MADCSGKRKSAATCNSVVSSCNKCTSVGCDQVEADECSNQGFRSGTCVKCGTIKLGQDLPLVMSRSFEALTDTFVLAIWPFYALGIAAIYRLRRLRPDMPRPYRCWGYPWVPVTFLLGAAALTISLWMARPIRSSIGLVLILSGLLFYSNWQRKLSSASEKPL